MCLLAAFGEAPIVVIVNRLERRPDDDPDDHESYLRFYLVEGFHLNLKKPSFRYIGTTVRLYHKTRETL